ncbi:hypothetical protein O9992_08155 [Vibrio lentus]|nr:hypothetical protein [Vibrio lentus]
MFEGEKIERGDVIADGPETPHDILRLRGIHAVTQYIANEVPKFTAYQGVKINVASRLSFVCKCRKCAITHSGDSPFLPWRTSWYHNVKIANRKLEAEGED